MLFKHRCYTIDIMLPSMIADDVQHRCFEVPALVLIGQNFTERRISENREHLKV
jgi:hypothetical protein